MKFKAMKFNIGKDPSASKAVQKRLIKLGYSWNGCTEGPQFLGNPYLYADSLGYITYGDADFHFEQDLRQECDIEWMKPTVIRKTVEVGDKTYYEDELAEALSKIKEVEND